MPNRPVLITGCQRSGTTMLNLALDSHPSVVGVDEMDFNQRLLPAYLEAPRFGPTVCFKLPGRAFDVPFIRELPGVRVLWALRDPRAVVASMIELPLRLQEVRVSWAAHPKGAGRELGRCLRLFGRVPPDLAPVMRRFMAEIDRPPGEWPLNLLTVSAALCWRLKNEIPAAYDAAGIAYRVVDYEPLVADPAGQLPGHIDFLGLPWDDAILRHHELHHGLSVGRTENTRPIDTRSLDKWKARLGDEQLALIRTICGDLAERHGYVI